MLGKPLTDDSVEFLPLLKRREKCEQFAVSRYGARQAVKRRRVLGDFASLYVGIRRKLENSIDDFVRQAGVRFNHGLGPPDVQLDADPHMVRYPRATCHAS